MHTNEKHPTLKILMQSPIKMLASIILSIIILQLEVVVGTSSSSSSSPQIIHVSASSSSSTPADSIINNAKNKILAVDIKKDEIVDEINAKSNGILKKSRDLSSKWERGGTRLLSSLKNKQPNWMRNNSVLFGSGSKLTFSTSFSIPFNFNFNNNDMYNPSSNDDYDNDDIISDTITDNLVNKVEDEEKLEQLVSNDDTTSSAVAETDDIISDTTTDNLVNIFDEEEKVEQLVNNDDTTSSAVAETGKISSSDSDHSTISISQETEDEKAVEAVEDTVDTDSILTMNLTFPLIQQGDGHENDEDGIPARFLRMQRNNRKAAQASFQHTLEWRSEHNIDTILSRPNTKYDLCKAILPHYFPGYDIQGNPVFVQKLGNLNITLCHLCNATTDEILNHYAYTMEYCWNILAKQPNAVMTNILDLQGLSFGFNILFRDKQMVSLIKRIIGLMSEHYPSRSYKTLIIHAPTWFQLMYRLIKPILRDSTKKKIEIYSAGTYDVQQMKNALKKYLGDDVRLYYDLLDDRDKLLYTIHDDDLNGLGLHSPLESQLRSFCMQHVEKAGLQMEQVLD